MIEVLYFIEYLKQSPLFIQLTWFASYTLLIIILLLVIYLKYLRSHLRTNERIHAVYQKKYESYLITYLYAETDEEISLEQQIIIDKLKKNISDPFKRSIIVSTLLKLSNEISGEMSGSIQKLYFQTGLVKYSFSKLENKKWDIVVKGIQELTQFHIKEAYNKIIIYVNHPKREVRKEMQLFMVNLFYFEGLNFLNNLKTPLSEWDQIQILEVLQKLDDQQISDIRPWLKSSNDFVVLFALKLAKIYNQFEVKEELLALLQHKNIKIRIDLIDVLSHLNVLESKKYLKDNFNNLSLEEQFEIFKMIENSYDNDDESFILEHLFHENFEIKLSALKTLKALNADQFNLYKNKSSDPAFLKIVKFIENN